MSTASPPIPRLPVMSWQTFAGSRTASLPCLLEQPGLRLTTSGRASILLAMEILGLKTGDKVLVPTYHCPTMIAPVVAVGAIPIFYPIDARGGPQLEWLHRQSLDGVKIILAAHYFGLPQPLQSLRRWCDETGIALIEDCAHSLFGVSGSRSVGKWGDVAIGSLTKFLPVPEGGCLQVNREEASHQILSTVTLAQQVKAVVDIVHIAAGFGRLWGFNSLLLGAHSLRQRLKPTSNSGQLAPAFHDEPSSDGYSIDIGLSHRQLTRASAWVSRWAPRARIVERRRRHFAKLAILLTGFSEFRPLQTELPAGAAPYVFPLWVDSPDPGYSRLREMGFPVSRWDRRWSDIPVIADDSGFAWSHHILQLACHQDLSDDDVEVIASTIIQLYASDNSKK